MEKNKAMNKSEKPKKKIRKFIFYICFVLIATAIALFFSLYKDPIGVLNHFRDCDWQWVGIILAVVTGSFIIDGFIIFIFMRLYTRKYHLPQGMAVSMIGDFYGSVYPGTKGGKIMQVYTLTNQGSQISNAASIIVMYFILYKIANIIFDIAAVIFNYSLLAKINVVPFTLGNWSINISLVPLTIIAFAINVISLLLLFLMSYSRGIHNFILHYGIGFLAKIHLLRDPDKKREIVRFQVENFKIELKRLLKNIPTTVVIVILFILVLICDYSIPWFAGMSFNGYGYYVNTAGEIVHSTGTVGFSSIITSCFLSCYHQMISGLIPIPGGAGVSEILFLKLFQNFYTTDTVISAAQILWRFTTFHLVLLVTGTITAFYKASPKKKTLEVDRKEYDNVEYDTFEERRISSEYPNVLGSSIFTNNNNSLTLDERKHQEILDIFNKEEKIGVPKIKSRSLFDIEHRLINNKNKKNTEKNEKSWDDFGIS